MSGISQEQMYECAKRTMAAEDAHQAIPQLIHTFPHLTFDEAYAIQDIRTKLRIEQGFRAIGYKMGLTSKAKQQMLGRTEPTFGRLFDYMPLGENEPLEFKKHIQPKVETEIAFVMKESLHGPDIDMDAALKATDYIVASLEIIDSRYIDFKFSSQDGIADNISASRIKLGNIRLSPYETNLAELGIKININDIDTANGKGSAVLDHPANAIIMLVKMLHREGKFLEAGQIVMTGAVTAAYKLSVGDKVTATFDALGKLPLAVV
ncbi:2-keto-4-pentenoate hydratase [Sporomusa aerivorans]|uniref:2-keto-4-pentenoate hydratase n=1 Tax=Sporomusa aerivorans TaxID=204936 RepID=UPI00352B95D9